MDNQAPRDSQLQTRFNLRGFLAGRNMQPQAQGTFDVSLEWPLQPLIDFQNALTNTTGGGPSFLFRSLIARRIGFHSLCSNLFIDVLTVTANDHLELRMTPPYETNGIASLNYQLLANVRFIPGRRGYALIGGISIELAADGGTIQGMRSIYIPEGWSLDLVFQSDPGGALNVRTQYLQFPSSQPLTALIGL